MHMLLVNHAVSLSTSSAHQSPLYAEKSSDDIQQMHIDHKAHESQV